MTTVDVDARSRHGWPVRTRAARDPGIARLRAMLSTSPDGLRAFVGGGSLYAWPAADASHADVSAALGFAPGEHEDLRVVALGDDPFGDRDEWALGPSDRVVRGVRVLAGSTPWDSPPLRALGFDRAPPVGGGGDA